MSILFILSSPSGAGKSTLAKELICNDDNIKLSVSTTTRSPRNQEKDGIDYYFTEKEKFLEMLEKEEFLEHTKIFDHYYGTTLATITQYTNIEKDILFDIDYHGMKSIKQKFPEHSVSIYILPPSLSILEDRLKNRDKNEEMLKQRMIKYKEEIDHYVEYDYIIINDSLEHTIKELASIVLAERRKVKRAGHDFTKFLFQ